MSVKVLGVPVRYSPVCCEQMQNTAFQQYELYNPGDDPEEKHDASKSEPKLYSELIAGLMCTCQREPHTLAAAFCGAGQVVCVNGLVFSLRRRLSGRWESGNPGFGFPLFHRP